MRAIRLLIAAMLPKADFVAVLGVDSHPIEIDMNPWWAMSFSVDWPQGLPSSVY